MLTCLYPSSQVYELCWVHIEAGNIKSLILDVSLCPLLLFPSRCLSLLYLDCVLAHSCPIDAQNQKVLNVNIMWNVLLLISIYIKKKQRKKSNHLTAWLLSFTLWCVSLCVPVAGLRCLASLVCTQSVCDYCPLQASRAVMRLFMKQLHLHRFCQEALKS